MRNLQRALLAGSLGFAVSFAAGCGASGAGLLTGNQASALQNELSQISSALSAGNCGTVRSGTRSLAEQVATLPTTVNGNLRQALDSEANQVSTLSVDQCHPPASTTTTPKTTTSTPTPTTNTQTTTTPTTPTQTNTTPTTPTTPATTPTTPGTNSGGGGLPGGTGGAGGAGGANNGSGNGNVNGQ